MRQAAESQASIWQETGKKMRRDLERLLTQEEQRRRDVEMDKAHNQRRAAEVDMTELQLRREAEQKLSKVLMSALSVCRLRVSAVCVSFLCLLGVSALSVCSLFVSAQQRMCEQLTRVVDIVAGLPPFQATFEKAPVSERLVIVMALGPYAVQSDTSGHVRAQFSKFAAANSADLLRLSLA